MAAFTQPLDVINRACQLLELPRIYSTADGSPQASELSFAYDKARRAMLRRNVWKFAIRRAALRPVDQTTVLLAPSAWVATTAYAMGAAVQDTAGNYWINQLETNTGGAGPGQPASGWEPYYGPLTVAPWNVPNPPEINTLGQGFNPYQATPGIAFGSTSAAMSYYVGEMVYLPKGDGTYQVFQATVTTPTNGYLSADGPLQADVWDASVTYFRGQLVAFAPSDPFVLGVNALSDGSALGAGTYQSTVDFNTGNEPDICQTAAAGGAVAWSATNTYSPADIVAGSDNQLYQSVQGGNLDNDPTTDTLFVWWSPIDMFAGTWTATISPSPRAISNGWLLIGATLSTIPISYPLTAGPPSDVTTRNAFRLPANHLREAPQDPKRGGIGWLGAPSGGLWYDDWEYNGDYIVSEQKKPILYRFVADVTDVRTMDDLFCEALASRAARDAQPILAPGRNDLFQRCKSVYQDAMEEASQINAIEAGSVEPPVDAYITCRL